MRTTTFLVLLVVMMCITFEVNGFVSSREQQANEAGEYKIKHQMHVRKLKWVFFWLVDKNR